MYAIMQCIKNYNSFYLNYLASCRLVIPMYTDKKLEFLAYQKQH